MSTLQEDLALERLAAERFQQEADEAWKAHQYTWARLCSERAREARHNVRMLELEEERAK